ncbi:MAG TPA: XisI protein [Gemmataceae bacterium]|nr:XisI protein [Gemmataceae bacterium]
MDSLSRAQAAVRDLLSQYADLDSQGPPDGLQTACVFDDEHGQYLVMRFGWSGQRRVEGILLHVRIHEGTVWLEENGTDRLIADELIARGVPAADIVLGFVPPEFREPLSSAVA